jgi:hypothetical protein
VKALDGNLKSFANFWDVLFYDNEMWMWSALASMTMDETIFWGKEKNIKKDEKKVFEMHLKVIFDAVINDSGIEEQYKKAFAEFNLDKLLFRMMCNKNGNVRKLIDPKPLLNFKNRNVTTILSDLLTSQNTVPDLSGLFEISKKYVRKSFENERKKDKNKEETVSEEVKKDNLTQIK